MAKKVGRRPHAKAAKDAGNAKRGLLGVPGDLALLA
jgi:hypothetical protein